MASFGEEIQHPVPDFKARGRGRPPSTTHDHVGGIALQLFARNGFDATTVDEIAAAAGISRRTLFRYYPSKNDMVWGDFDWVLERLRTALDTPGPDRPLMEQLTDAVIESNRYAPEELPELRIRLTLISTVPTLQAHSMLRYADWRRVLAEFVARRLGADPDDLIPTTIGWAALGASMAAFLAWIRNPGDDLEVNLTQSYALLSNGLGGPLP